MSVVYRPAAAALFVALLTVPAPTAAHATGHPPTDLQARTWATTCVSCYHADITPGAKLPAQTLPPLAGCSQAELTDTMQAFRNGARPFTVMGQIARDYDGAQITAIAGRLSRQPQEAPWTNGCVRTDVHSCAHSG